MELVRHEVQVVRLASQLGEHSGREAVCRSPFSQQIIALAHERDRNGHARRERLAESAHEAEELPRLRVRHRVLLVVEIDAREPVVAHDRGGGGHEVGGPRRVRERVLEPRVSAGAADADHAPEWAEWVVRIRVLQSRERLEHPQLGTGRLTRVPEYLFKSIRKFKLEFQVQTVQYCILRTILNVNL